MEPGAINGTKFNFKEPLKWQSLVEAKYLICLKVDGEGESCYCMFKNKDSLRDHERRIHEKRSYPCNYCELEFPERTQRCRHEKRNHTEYAGKRKKGRTVGSKSTKAVTVEQFIASLDDKMKELGRLRKKVAGNAGTAPETHVQNSSEPSAEDQREDQHQEDKDEAEYEGNDKLFFDRLDKLVVMQREIDQFQRNPGTYGDATTFQFYFGILLSLAEYQPYFKELDDQLVARGRIQDPSNPRLRQFSTIIRSRYDSICNIIQQNLPLNGEEWKRIMLKGVLRKYL